jgi:O-antigen/teichoic acid export membrane protein
MIKKALPSLIDQLLVSGGNFLIIALSAHFLDFVEQGKLAYIISAYMITVMLNVAIFFYAAPLVNVNLEDNKTYRSFLQWGQLYLSILSSLSITLFFALLGKKIGWDITKIEIILLFIYLTLQQLIDFRRRESYIFTSILDAIKSSAITYIPRITLLFLIQPYTIYGVLLILVISSLWSAISFLLQLDMYALIRSWSIRDQVKEHIRLSKFSMFNAPISWALFFLPIFILGVFHSPAMSAVLLSVRSISGVVNVFLELLETFIPVWMVNIFNKDGSVALKKTSSTLLKFGFLLWFIVLVFILIFGFQILHLILGEGYASYVDILLISWIGNGIHFISRVVGLYWRSTNIPKVELMSSIGGLFVFLISIPIIISHGLLGAAWMYILVPIGMVITQLLYAKFYLR